MIYEIVCNETGERYIGSTFERTLARRMSSHRYKGSNCKSKQIIGRWNYTYGLLEKVDVTTRDELRMKERVWYDKLPNINHFSPYVSEEEFKEKKKKYRKDNKERIKEYDKNRNLKRKMALTTLSLVPPEVASLSSP